MWPLNCSCVGQVSNESVVAAAIGAATEDAPTGEAKAGVSDVVAFMPDEDAFPVDVWELAPVPADVNEEKANVPDAAVNEEKADVPAAVPLVPRKGRPSSRNCSVYNRFYESEMFPAGGRCCGRGRRAGGLGGRGGRRRRG